MVALNFQHLEGQLLDHQILGNAKIVIIVHIKKRSQTVNHARSASVHSSLQRQWIDKMVENTNYTMLEFVRQIIC